MFNIIIIFALQKKTHWMFGSLNSFYYLVIMLLRDYIHKLENLSLSVVKNALEEKLKGPRSYLCTQVPCIAVKKWNRSIITECNIFL